MESSQTKQEPVTQQGDMAAITGELSGILESLTFLNTRLATVSDVLYGSRPTAVLSEKDSAEPCGRVAQIEGQLEKIKASVACAMDEAQRLESLG